MADFQVRVRWPSTMVVGGSVRRRIRGVRIVSDDGSWSHGSGEEVRGSPEALLLMLTGRPVGEDELTGPGADAFALLIEPDYKEPLTEPPSV